LVRIVDFGFVGLVGRRQPTQHDVPGGLVDHPAVAPDAGADQVGEYLFVAFEQAPADIHEYVLGDLANEVGDAGVQVAGHLGLVHGHLEQPLEVGQRVLVHGVDHGQVAGHEVEDRAAG
jgi:hypothetical protein